MMMQQDSRVMNSTPKSPSPSKTNNKLICYTLNFLKRWLKLCRGRDTMLLKLYRKVNKQRTKPRLQNLSTRLCFSMEHVLQQPTDTILLLLPASTYCTKLLPHLASGAKISSVVSSESSFTTACLICWWCTVRRRRGWRLATLSGRNSVLSLFVTWVGVLFLVIWLWIEKPTSSSPGPFQGMLMPWLMKIGLQHRCNRVSFFF